MSALGGAFEQGDRDIKFGRVKDSDLPKLQKKVEAVPAAEFVASLPPAPAPTPAIVESVPVSTPPPATPPPAPVAQQAPPAPTPFVVVEGPADCFGEEVKSDVSYSGPPASALRIALLDLDEPIAKRTHAAFYLRTLGNPEAIGILMEALSQRKDSALMRHELAYILGQIGNATACPALTAILDDEGEDVLVRHECAEALGAIGQSSSCAILDKYKSHEVKDISETCQIALDLIAYRNSPSAAQEKAVQGKTRYRTVDPAPGYSEEKPVAQLLEELVNSSGQASLFKRYRAMFTLRNMDTDEAALTLCEGFKDPSALFRHEVAYVLGQMQKEVTVPALTDVLTNTDEHRMVRHEAAEALGSIGGEEVELILGEFLDDPEVVVTESCEVALDTLDYWENFK
jgi:deoxyhypusine monooxygenase